LPANQFFRFRKATTCSPSMWRLRLLA
jgi:hypothetical protein